MKRLLPFALSLLSCGSQVVTTRHSSDAAATDLVTVHGSARLHPSWCAGVAPPREAEDAARKGVPMTTPLFIHAGDRYEGGQPIARIMPDAAGQFEVGLPPGRYCVVLEAHELPSASIPPEADAACVRAQRVTCDSLWVVDAARARLVTGGPIEIVHHTSCDWNRPCFPAGPAPP